MKYDIIRNKSYNFALRIIDLSKKLDRDRNFVISRQILKSGTSIAANLEEAVGGESTQDLVHKCSIAYKECRETIYWLNALKDSKILKEKETDKLLSDATEIIKILTTIIKNNKAKLKK